MRLLPPRHESAAGDRAATGSGAVYIQKVMNARIMRRRYAAATMRGVIMQRQRRDATEQAGEEAGGESVQHVGGARQGERATDRSQQAVL